MAKVQRTDLAEGYYTLPAGLLANAVTWLEMRVPPRGPIAAPLRLVRATEADAGLCRDLFRRIGTPWLWSRAFAKPDGPARPNDTHLAHDDAGTIVGIVEFDGRGNPEVEIAWFGLTPEATGQRLGRRMMAAALDLAWASGPERVWLHTCTLDHPAAPRFYRACGFVPYAAGFEIMPDPRLTGQLPRDAAPQVPMVEAGGG